MSWQTRTLGSVIREHGGLVQTGPFGSQLHQSDYTNDGVPTVMPKDIKVGRIDETSVARVSERKAAQLSRHLLKPNSIVFPRRGNIGKCAYVESSQAGFICGTGCIKIEVPPKVLFPRFMFYYLSTRHVADWLERNAVGTTMLNLSSTILGRLPVPDITLTQQRTIAGVLSAYDDLIENNQRRIQLLEQAARLLYKEWFVHLRFPGHEHVNIRDGVPEGWERKPLGKVAPLQYGKALKQEDRVPGPYPVYGSSGIVGTHHKALVVGPAIIVGRKGNVGSIYLCKSDFHPIDTVYFIEVKHCHTYLYYALMHTQFINTDVAVPGLNRDFAHSRILLVPDNRILALFDQDAGVIHEQIDGLTRFNASLTQARDLLLPRLMKGEIAV